MIKALRFVLPPLIGLAAIAILGWQFGLHDLRAALGRVSPARLVLYLCCSAGVIAGHSLRWLLVARSLWTRPSLARLMAARLAGDAVGALVPSAKLAGEPVRVALVRAGGVAGAEAGAGVSIDRLLEVIGNMVCCVAYVSIFSLTHVGASVRTAPAVVATMLALLAALAIPLTMLRRGLSPLAPLYGVTAQRWLRPLAPWMPTLRRIEAHLQRFFRDHAGVFAVGLIAALLTEGLVIAQYHFLLSAFAIDLDAPTLLLALVGTGFARAAPTPAGLGALEVSQVGVLALAAGRPEAGFVVGLVMRLHETLWIVVGLAVLAARGGSLAQLRRLKLPGKAAA